jgi:hypothetical protein
MDTQAIALFSAIASAGKTVFDIAQSTTKAEEKDRLMDVYDTLMDLKRAAADLEDENRELKLKLRFKSDDFAFRSPFYYEKNDAANQPFCPKCFSNEKTSPMGPTFRYNDGPLVRSCLVCNQVFSVGQRTTTDY